MKKSEYIFVRSDRKMIKINFADILYVESLSDYIKIHLTDRAVVTRETISNIEAKLPSGDFMRVHRSFIVSFHNIISFTNELVQIDRVEIPLGRSYKKEVLKRLEKNNFN